MDPFTRDAAYRMTIEQRITELLRWRTWYRQHAWADWTDLRSAHDIELRALVRLARKARRAAAMADQAKEREARRLAESWAESLRQEEEAWTNREGMPEFNGSFR